MFAGYITVEMGRNQRFDPKVLLYPAVATLVFISIHLVVRFLLPRADGLLLPLCAGLTAVGLVMIYSIELSNREHDLITNYASRQLLWTAVAAVCLVLVAFLFRNYETLAQYKYTIGLAALVLLALTMIVGTTINGSRLWIVLGPVRFQPSELAKVLMVIFLASFLAEKHEVLSVSTHRVLGIPVPEFKHFGPLVVMWGLSVLMMIFQRDLGSSLLFFGIFICMLYASTARKAYVLVGLALFVLGAFLCYLAFSHVHVRVTAWLDPFNADTVRTGSYQISQSLFSLAAGGISGTGLGLGSPPPHTWVATDFIFSAIGEEMGLLGAFSVLLMYVLFTARGIKLALKQRADFGKLLAVGFTSAVALQAFLIMGGSTRLIPLTGITLPFVSYGGSSLVANFIILGFLLVISHKGATDSVTDVGEVARE